MTATLKGLLEPDADPVDRILVATDGSPASEPAVERAIQLAATLHCGLLVLMVGRPPTRGAPAAILEEIVRRAAGRGVAARWLHWRGDPGDAILAVADAEDVDLIVVGSHARPTGRSRVRSVSGHVVRHGRRPVLVVQPWAEVGSGGQVSSSARSPSSRGEADRLL